MRKLIMLLPVLALAACDTPYDRADDACRAALDETLVGRNVLVECHEDVYAAEYHARNKALKKYRNLPRLKPMEEEDESLADIETQ